MKVPIKTRRAVLLADEPAGEDSFGGPHDRIADAIASLIRDEEGGKAIGLEGGWGAGKSTVVQLLRRKLGAFDNKDIKVIVFDVWAHQGDPLRRTFLEKLIDQMRDSGWVPRGAWDDRANELAKRKREVVQRVIPQLTNYGIAFAISLIALPTGSAMIASGATLLAAKDGSTLFAILFLVFGFLLVMSPIGVLLWTRIQRNRLRKNAKNSQAADDLAGIPALVTGQSTTETKTLVTESPEPTSVEFEAVFRELCDEALCDEVCGISNNRLLVLVIDNLDRVDPDNALAVWSTLQTFLQYSEHDRPKWFHRLWVLVPYDGESILTLWGEPKQKGRSQAVGESFLDKTFQIRFRIPPPAIANWREYLSNALATALPDHAATEFHDVFRAFALRKGVEAAKPRPRDLKLFVNEVGAIHRQWRQTDEFTLAEIACFVLLQRDGATEEALVSTTENESASFAQRVAGDEWRDKLAVLYFNAPVGQARQLLLRGPIESALSGADGAALRRLESANGDSFWAVFEHAVPTGSPNWEETTTNDIASTGTALDTSGFFTDPENSLRREATALLDRVTAEAIRVEAWDPFTEEMATGLVSLGRVVGPHDSLVNQLCGAVGAAELAQGDGNRSDSVVTPIEWTRAALVFLEGFGGSSTIESPMSADQWMSVPPQLPTDERAKELVARIDLKAINEIDSTISQRIAAGSIDAEAMSILDLTLCTHSGDSLNETSTQLLSGFASAAGIVAAEVALHLRAILSCKASNLVTEKQFESLATRGSILHHLFQAASESNPEALALCVHSYLISVPSARQPDVHIGNSAGGHDHLILTLRNPNGVAGTLEQFIAAAKQTDGLSGLARILDANPPDPKLINAAFAHLIEEDYRAREPDFIKNHWRKIRSNLPTTAEVALDPFQQHLESLASVSEISELVATDQFNNQDSALYTAIVRSGAQDDFASWCAINLRSVSANDWATSLRNCDELIELVLELKKREPHFQLGPDFLDGLAAHASLAANSEINLDIADVFQDLIALVEMELLTRRTYDALEASNGGANQPFFELYGGVIANGDYLAGRQGFVDRVCRPLITADNAEGLSWLANVCKCDPTVFDRHPDRSGVSDFRERVRSRLINAPTEGSDSESLIEIATALHIDGTVMEGEIHDSGDEGGTESGSEN